MSGQVNQQWTRNEIERVLAFWFDEVGAKGWFGGGAELDRAIKERFGDLHGVVRAAPDDVLLADAASALAAIIVLDQFSRQIFRGRAEAFASDGKALRLADSAVKAGYDMAAAQDRRVFFYLPFEHAEDLAMQDRSVELTAGLGDEVYTKYAVAHRDVIAKFGRFPHRNAALGRTSTDAEIAYLAEPGSGF